MGDIVLSAGVRQNLLSLQSTAQLMALTQNRLATGKKVNSALDNPVNFFTAGALHSRARDLSALLDSMSNGIKTLEAADNALTSITTTVQSMQSTLRQARQDKSFKTESYAINLGAPPLGTEQMSFSGGAVGATPVNLALATGPGIPTAASITGGAFAALDFNPSAPTAGTNSSAYVANGATWAATDTVSITLDVDGNGPVAITLTQAQVAAVGNNDSVIDNIGELTSVINAAIGASALAGDVTASNDGTNIIFTSASTGTNSTVEITAVDGDPDAGNIDFGAAPFGITTGAGTAGAAAGPAKTLTFSVTAETGGAQPVTIDLAAVQAVGNNDGIIDSVAELAAIIDAQLSADVAVDGTGAALVLSSATTGITSTLAIGAVTATNITNTSGIANGNATGANGPTAKSIDALVAEINNHADLKDNIRASNDNGKLRIQNLSTLDLTVGGIGAAPGTITGGAGTSEIAGNDVRKALVQQFNMQRDQLDKFSDDAYFNGVNLMLGDRLKLVFNETGVSSIEIQARDNNGNVIAINSSYLNIVSVTAPDFDSDINIDGMLDTMGYALESLRAQASNFGSHLSIVQNRQDFTKRMINTLETGGDNLLLADTNEEGANLLALQTRQQLSTTALSLSAQADQAVLRLFG